MACLLPSVIDAVDVVDVVDADSVDDVLWIPRVERLRRAGATIDLPTGVACHTATSLLLIHFTLFQLFAKLCVIYLMNFVVKLRLLIFLLAVLYAGLAMGVCQLELLQNRLYSQRH